MAPAAGESAHFVREGDTLVVHSMDRLTRNLDDLRRLLQQLAGLKNAMFASSYNYAPSLRSPWRAAIAYPYEKRRISMNSQRARFLRCILITTFSFSWLAQPSQAQLCQRGWVTEPRPDGVQGALSIVADLCPLGNDYQSGEPGVVPISQGRQGGIKEVFEAGVPVPSNTHGRDIMLQFGFPSIPAPINQSSIPASVDFPKISTDHPAGLRDQFHDQKMVDITNLLRPNYEAVGAQPVAPTVHPGGEQDRRIASSETGFLPTDLGGPDLSALAGRNGDDPVHPGTGEFIHQETDITLAGVGDIQFHLQRIYRSRSSYHGPMGHGWMHSYDQRLEVTFNQCNEVFTDWRTGRGAVLRFARNNSGAWHSVAGTALNLVRGPGNTREIVSPDGIRRIFDTHGVLQAIVDRNGNEMRFTHSASTKFGKQLDLVVDPLGRQIRFSYGSDEYLDRVEVLGHGIWNRYHNDAFGDLRKVEFSAGSFEEYFYDTKSSRLEAPVLLPTPGLQGSCEAMCGATPDSCGGVCRAEAQSALSRCYFECMDYDGCERECNKKCSDDCSALAGAPEMDNCREMCGTGCYDVPAPERCEYHRPAHPRDGFQECANAAGHVLTNTTHPTTYSETPRRGCLPEDLWDEQHVIYEACLADPPPRYVCMSGHNRPGDTCRSAKDQCGGIADSAERSCDNYCDNELDCKRECRPHTVCAKYTAADFSFSIWIGGSHDIGGGADTVPWTPGNYSVKGVDFDYSGPLWTGQSCKPPACPSSALSWEPDGDANVGSRWECNFGDCVDHCEDDCSDRCQNGVEFECRHRTHAACDSRCNAGCYDVVVGGCLDDVCSGCFNACNSELYSLCHNTCNDTDWMGQCTDVCTATCIEKNSALGAIYGNEIDLNHNLVKIRDGEGVDYLVLTYDTDIHSRMFDQVVHQDFGGDQISYRYYDLTDEALSLNADDAQRVDTAPASLDICLSTCEDELGRAGGAGTERWVRVGGGAYAIFRGLGPSEATSEKVYPASPGHGGWPVDTQGETGGLGAYDWFEVRMLSGLKSGEAALRPQSMLPATLRIATAGGAFTIKPDRNKPGALSINAESSEALEAAFGGDGSGTLTLLHTERGYVAYPGRVVGGAYASDPSACADSFVAMAEDRGSPVAVFPEGACEGSVTFTELGRRGGARIGDPKASAPWDSLLTDPRGSLTWVFEPGDAKPQLGDVVWDGDPLRDKGGAGRIPGELCGIPEALPIPDPECVQAMGSFGGTGVAPPDCTDPFFTRGGSQGYTPWPDDADVVLGCGAGPGHDLPPLPPACRGGTTYVSRELPFAQSSIQPITRATVVEDPSGAAWVYYADVNGTVLRLVNADTGSRLDWNYDDDDGRLIGTRSAWGDRTCFEYDDERNPFLVTKLPAAGDPRTDDKLVSGFSYGPYGLVETVWDVKASQPVTVYQRDPVGNVEEIHRHTGQHVVVTKVTTDAFGRVEKITHPGGRVDRTIYDPKTGAPSDQIFAEGLAIERHQKVSSNAQGRVTGVSEAGRPTVSSQYTASGTLLLNELTLDPRKREKQTSHFSLNAAGQIVAESGPEADTTYTYNGRGLVESVSIRARTIIGAWESHVRCQRYEAGRLVDTIDPEGRWLHLERDPHGDVVSVARGIQPISGQDWDARCVGNLTDGGAAGWEVFEAVDRDRARGGAIVAIREAPGTPDEVVTRFVYDGFSRLVEKVLGDGTRVRVGYDPQGHVAFRAILSANAPPLSRKNRYEPNPQNDADLIELTLYGYDRQGRLTTRSQAWFDDSLGTRQFGGANGFLTTVFDYDEVGRTVTITDPEGKDTVVRYDELGREVHRTLADGSTTVETSFNAHGLDVTTTVKPVGNPAGQAYRRTIYTPFGLPAVQEMRSGMQIWQGLYDRMGRLVSEKSPVGTHGISYDGFGRLGARTRDIAGVTTPFQSFRHNRNDVVTRMEDGEGHAVTWTFDLANRPVATSFPNGTAATQSYLPGSERIGIKVDRGGNTRTHSYDSAGRLSHVAGLRTEGRVLAEAHLDFVWGPHGLEVATSHRGSTSSPGDLVTLDRTRDSLGQVVTEWTDQFATAPIDYSYDALGRVTSLARKSVVTEFSWDALDRLDQVFHGGQLVVDYDYLGHGPPHSQTFGNSLVEYAFYDEDSRLTAKLVDSGTQTLAAQRFFWGDDLTLARVDRNHGSWVSSVFLTDSAGRLEAAGYRAPNLATVPAGRLATTTQRQTWLSAASRVEDFDYDFVDNLIRVQRGSSVVQPAFGTDNRYTDFDGSVTTDVDGRVLELPDGTKFELDGLGRIMDAVTPSGEERHFLYDAWGRLVGWSDARANDQVAFQWGQGRIVQQWTNGAETAYVPGLHQAPAAVVDVAAGTTVYNHHGLGGRLSRASDANGTIVEEYAYDAYGTPSIKRNGSPVSESAVGNRLLLTGQPWLSDLAIYRQGQRWYRPEWGRFLTPDPAGFADGPNRFAYATSHPLLYVDPTGLGRRDLDQSGSGDSSLLGGLNALILTETAETAGHLNETGNGVTAANNLPPMTAEEMLYQVVGGGIVIGGIATGGLLIEGGAALLVYAPGALLAVETGLDVAGAVSSGYGCIAYGDGYECVAATASAIDAIPGFVSPVGDAGQVGSIGSGRKKRVFDSLRLPRLRSGRTPDGSRGVGCPECPCFVPGTRVLMADGTTKAIEDVVSGDVVLADDPEDENKAAPREVIAVMTNFTERVIRIEVGDHSDPALIEATGEHPFWTEAEGWVAADSLEVGDRLRDANGGGVAVVGVASESRETPTHNLTVKGAHTYFVAIDEDNSVLVHNQTIDKDGFFAKSHEYGRGKGRGQVRIPYQGSRSRDFTLANKMAGFDATPDGYTWHHANYNPRTGWGAMQLVREVIHGGKPHSGGVSKFRASIGLTYDTEDAVRYVQSAGRLRGRACP